MTTEARLGDISAIGLLDEPVRRRVYEWVSAQGRPVGRDETARALEIGRPAGWVRQVPIRAVDDSRVELEDGASLNSATLANLVQGSPAVQLFVVTLGPRLDERVHELFEAMDGLEGLFLDTAGWVVVQSALSSVRKRCAAKARSAGYRLTRRIGPGYLDWPLEEQSIVFRALAADKPLPPAFAGSNAPVFSHMNQQFLWNSIGYEQAADLEAAARVLAAAHDGTSPIYASPQYVGLARYFLPAQLLPFLQFADYAGKDPGRPTEKYYVYGINYGNLVTGTVLPGSPAMQPVQSVDVSRP